MGVYRSCVFYTPAFAHGADACHAGRFAECVANAVVGNGRIPWLGLCTSVQTEQLFTCVSSVVVVLKARSEKTAIQRLLTRNLGPKFLIFSTWARL